MPTRTRGIPIFLLSGALLFGCAPDEATSPSPDVAPPQGLRQSEAGSQAGLSAEVNRQLAAVRNVTAPFHDLDKAVEAGFVPITPCLAEPGSGAQGYHYAIPSRIDGSVELLEPELIQYEPQRNGSLRLVGVEYIVPLTAWNEAEPPELLGQHFHVNEAFGIYALHVWAWRHNPSGLFADWNPKVTCEFAAD